MMKDGVFRIGILAMVFMLFSCQDRVTEPGTYKGTITTVNNDPQEIFVETVDLETIHIRFTERTKVTKNGDVMDFSALAQGQHVTVQLEKFGDAVEATHIEITQSYPPVEDLPDAG